MVKLSRNTPEKREKILSNARSLFVRDGYDATTLAMIAKASGTVVGSVMHFFETKSAIAALLHEEAMQRLVSAVAKPLNRQRTDVTLSVEGLVSACITWAADHPNDLTLFSVLYRHAGPPSEIGAQIRLEPVLLEWAKPLMAQGRIRELLPAQLYAIVMAPILSAVASMAGRKNPGPDSPMSWPRVLTTAVVSALAPAAVRVKAVKPSTTKLQENLF